MSEPIQQVEKEQAPINWAVSAVLGLTFLVAVTIVPWYGIVYGYTGWDWAFFGIFVMLTGIGIGSGYHRLWSHRTYQAHPALQWFLAIVGGMALQNSTIVWCARHRIHHKDVDDNAKTRTLSAAVSGLLISGGCSGIMKAVKLITAWFGIYKGILFPPGKTVGIGPWSGSPISLYRFFWAG